MEHSNLQKKIRKKRNLNLAPRTLKFPQIKPERTDPLLHYSSESLSNHLTPWKSSYSCAGPSFFFLRTAAGSGRPARGSGRPWSSTAEVAWRGGSGGPHAYAGLPSMARRGLWWRGHSSSRGDGSRPDGGEQQRPKTPVKEV